MEILSWIELKKNKSAEQSAMRLFMFNNRRIHYKMIYQQAKIPVKQNCVSGYCKEIQND